jgi:hypothetical protein
MIVETIDWLANSIEKIVRFIAVVGIRILLLGAILTISGPLLLLGFVSLILGLLIPPLGVSAKSFFTDIFYLIVDRLKGLFERT